MVYQLTAAAVLIVDILSKRAAVTLKGTRGIEIIKNILDFTYVENRGIAFGAFSGGGAVFVFLSILLIGILCVYLLKSPKERRTPWQLWGIALIFSGAAGNLIDRIRLGYVVDFINFKLIDFPVFNVADIAVCTGVVLLAVHILFLEKIEDNPNN